MVRMLYDPALVEAVYREPGPALAGLDLTEEERGWLVARDVRAWGTDPVRRARSLTGLLEEFPVSSAFVLRRGREGVVRPETELLDAFFSSAEFHACIGEGSSMVLAYATFLARGEQGGVVADPRVAPLARLEEAIARLRRIPEPPPTGHGPGLAETRYALASWAAVCVLPAGLAELHGRVSKAIAARDKGVVATVLDPRWSLPVLLEPDPALEEPVLVERPPRPGWAWASAPVTQAPVTPEMAGLLRFASGGRTRDELEAEAGRLGATPDERPWVVASVLAEGLLVPVGA
jgi:hypothetical protein